MKATKEKSVVTISIITLALVVAFVPWIYAEHIKAITPDIFWLTKGAGRLLHGSRMVDAIYDPNPPLSIIVYIPVYLLTCTGLSIESAVLITTAVYLIVTSIAVYMLAGRVVGPDAAIVTISFLLAGTVLCTAEFGQRDQFVALTLMPFILGQIILTRRIPCPRALVNAVFMMGSVVILLKPHFGLVPAAFLIHRGLVQKRWGVVRDPDFVMLATCSILYIAAIWFYFHDYATIIFPDVLKLYVPDTRSMVVLVYSAILVFIYLDILVLLHFMKKRTGIFSTLTRIMFICALLCIIPYLVQMKDFKYHLVPSLTFFWTGMGLLGIALARCAVSPGLSAALVISVLSAAGYMSEPSPSYLSIVQAESLPLTRIVAECGPHCRFMMLDQVVRTMLTTERYSGKENPSRFPSLWFLPRLIAMPPGTERDRLFQKYARFLAEDIDEGRPDMVISCNEQFDYVGYFSRDAGFSRALNAYRQDGTVSVDYGAYYPEAPPGLLKKYQCQIYRRGEAGR